jgi:hypothetical protein
MMVKYLLENVGSKAFSLVSRAGNYSVVKVR